MVSRKRRWIAVFLTTLGLLLAAVLWFIIPAPLSPLEQSLVGSWYPEFGPPRYMKPRNVLELRSDRSCLSHRLVGSELIPRTGPAGRWEVKRGVLIVDWRQGIQTVLPVEYFPGSFSLRRVQLPRLRWEPRIAWSRSEVGRIVAVTEDELAIQCYGDNVESWKRYEEPGAK